MVDFKNTTDIVKHILQEVPETRNSDDYLYIKVCEKINGVILNMPFWKVMLKRNEYGFPAFETVRRTRQKLQHDNPELAADDQVEGFRMENEKAYRAYARKV